MEIRDQYAHNIFNTENLQIVLNVDRKMSIEQLLDSCMPEVDDFINDFSEQLRDLLNAAKQTVYQKLVNMDQGTFNRFLERYRYPQKQSHNENAGVAALWKFLIVCQLAYPEWELDDGVFTKNLYLGASEWRKIVYSCWGNQTMPKIMIGLASEKNLLRHLNSEGKGLFPHKIIIKNSDRRKDNLCLHCGIPRFPFVKILRDFGKNQDLSIFQRAGEENSFKILEEVEVYSGECLYNEIEQATNEEDLNKKIRSVL